MEREAYRAYHHRNRIHKADHFYNFCVTAHSMRDFYLERIGKTSKADRSTYENAWSNEEFLMAVANIANSAKHFMLRDRRTNVARMSKTRTVRTKTSRFIDLYIDNDGNLQPVQGNWPDISIQLLSGAKYDLYQFTNGVLEYWRTYLKNNGIAIRRQPLDKLIG